MPTEIIKDYFIQHPALRWHENQFPHQRQLLETSFHAGAQCLKNRGEGDILCWAYAFLNMFVLALKSFFTFKYTSCLALTFKKFQSVLKKF